MKPSEEQITRWIDGELHDYEREEFEALLLENPQLLAEKAAADRAGQILREVLPAEKEPPYADFFNSQIQKEIGRVGEESTEPPAPAPAGILLSISSWFRSPLGALGAAAAAAVVTFFVVKPSTPVPSAPDDMGTGQAVVTSIYAPDESVSVSTYYSEEAGASVIIVDGLEEIPSTYEIRGNLAGNPGLDNAVAAGTRWRNLPSDDEVINWIAVSFRGLGTPSRSL